MQDRLCAIKSAERRHATTNQHGWGKQGSVGGAQIPHMPSFHGAHLYSALAHSAQAVLGSAQTDVFSIRPDGPASLDHVQIDIEALAPVTPAWQRPPILDNSESDHRLSRFIQGDIETTIKVVYEEETGTC